MKNPFGRRTPCGEYEFPFHMELYNPDTQGEVEAYATKWRMTPESMVDITVLLNDGRTEVPARVLVVNGKFAAIYFPADGMSTSDWGNRRAVAAAYVTAEYRRMTEESNQAPPTPQNPFASATTNGKRKWLWWAIPSAAFALTLFAILAVWGSEKYSNAQKSIGVQLPPAITRPANPAADIPPTVTSNPGNNDPGNHDEGAKQRAIEEPLISARSADQSQKSPSVNIGTGDVTADSVMRSRACRTPVAVTHSGDLEIAACGCEHQTTSGIACSLFMTNTGHEEKEFAVKAGNTADDNVGNSVTIYHDNIICGEGGSKTILYPGVPKNCYVKYEDKSEGAAKYATLHLYVRWDNTYGMLPPVGKIPIS